MFGRRPNLHFHDHTVTENVNVRVTEKRAPTDESVRLLKEFEDAARGKIVDSFVLQDNGFNCKVMVMQEANTWDCVAISVYTLNGKQITTETRISSYDLKGNQYDRSEKLFKLIIDDVAKDISRQILIPCFEEIYRSVPQS